MLRTIILTIIIFMVGCGHNDISTDKIERVSKKIETMKIQYPWLKKERLKNAIVINSIKYKIEPELVCAIIEVESNGRNIRGKRNKNGSYDYGFMQINQVHEPNKPHLLFTPEINIKKGCWYLAHCLKRSNGKIITAIGKYNMGANAKKLTNLKYMNKVFGYYLKSKREMI